ncbi:MAG: indolepyruvate oxidoreductase subunit beta [Spirochaetales bacterium]|nr:indolepyruvate oxidoreductase subunit beta [Spirochaetales bacterium]MCF7938925.1 indolepyruvate oxidoreductase subunit beta [Spirochaetales bacterium]
MANRISNVLMVGVGGQGVILASDILTLAAMHAGFDAKKSEIHGMSQRGGSVFSHIRFGKKVWSPTIAEGEADILFSLEEMETLRWLRFAGPRTRIICIRRQLKPAEVTEYPEGLDQALRTAAGKVEFLDPKEVVEIIGKQIYLNTAILGYMAGDLDIPEAAWQEAIRERVPEDTFEANWTAFEAGKVLPSTG